MSDDASSSTPSLLERIAQVFGSEPQNQQELKQVLHAAHDRRLLDSDSLSMIDGVFEVAGMRVRDVMITRGRMVSVDYDDKLEELLGVIIESGHSRFPVLGKDGDEVVGVLLAKDLLQYTLPGNERPFRMADVMRKPVMTPDGKHLNVLLREFRLQRNHMAIVVNEFGVVAGLVTIEDVLEQIVGEIDDEYDDEDEAINIREHDDGRYSVRALTPIEDFNEHLGTQFPDDEFDTIGGLVTHEIGRMPKPSDSVVIGGYVFRVLAADSRRVHILQVVPENQLDD